MENKFSSRKNTLPLRGAIGCETDYKQEAINEPRVRVDAMKKCMSDVIERGGTNDRWIREKN